MMWTIYITGPVMQSGFIQSRVHVGLVKTQRFAFILKQFRASVPCVHVCNHAVSRLTDHNH